VERAAITPDRLLFCKIKTTEVNYRICNKLNYPDLPSARRPVPHDDSLPVPKIKQVENVDENLSMQDGHNDYVFTRSNSHIITQIELNDLIRDLNLSKEKSEILGCNDINDINCNDIVMIL